MAAKKTTKKKARKKSRKKKKEKKKEKKQKTKPGKSQDKQDTSRRKSLLIATDSFLPRWDGISRFLSEIIPCLEKSFDISILCPNLGTSKFDSDQKITLIKIPMTRFGVGDFTLAQLKYKTVRRAVKKSDVVFSQTIGPIGALAIKAAKKYNKRTVSFIHSIEWELVTKAAGWRLITKYLLFATKIFARRMYSRSNLLIVPSENIAEMLSWQKIKTRKKIIHLGIDTRKFIPPQSRAEAKKVLGIDPDTMIIGHHGRLGREKDLMTLLRAYIKLKKTMLNTALLIVGDGVESIKKKLASVSGVILPGSRDNVVPYLQAMDVYCLPSLTETTSLSTLEAMACGVPVIATRVGFVKDYLEHGFNGVFFKERNSYDLARKIMFLLNRPGLEVKLSSNARKTVEREFTWEKTAREIEETLRGLV